LGCRSRPHRTSRLDPAVHPAAQLAERVTLQRNNNFHFGCSYKHGTIL
jgi:hypothetical protein